jgi:hypothetical protein
MTQRIVSVGDDFALPVGTKVLDSHLPARLGEGQLSATYGTVINVMSEGVLPGPGPTTATSVTAALNTLFQTPGTYYFPAPVDTNLYLLDGTVTIGPNVNVICHPDAVFYLQNFVRDAGGAHVHMFVTDPAKNNGTITWTGGSINSNEGNQYGQGGDGVNYDAFKGFIFQNAAKVVLKNMKIQNQRGSAVEFWNIDHFVADDIEVQMLIPTVNGQKSGGYRRGGLTGSARFVSINSVYGYAGDDLVCVAAGIDWGQPGKVPIDVDTAIITNIRPTEKLNEPGRGTWTGVACYAQNGYKFKNLIIDNVVGASQGSMVRVGSYAYGSDAPDEILNDFHNVTISNISGYMKGYTLPDGLKTVGAVPSVAFISLPSLTCKNLIIENVNMQMYADELFDNPVISSGGSAIERMVVRGVNFYSEGTTVNNCPIYGQGSAGYVRDATFEACGHTYPNAADYGTRLIYNSASSSKVAARVRYRTCGSGDPGTGTPQLNTAVVNGKITPISQEVVMDYSNTAIVAASGATFHDRASGVIAYREGAWTTVQERVIPYSSNSGKPSSGKWEVGFRCRVTGAPFKSIIGWVCTDAGTFGSGDPIFLPITLPKTSDNTGLVPTTSISSFVPGVTTSHEIGGAAASGWPENAAGIPTTSRGLADINSWQEYRIRQSTARPYRRYWDTTALAWSAWSNA